MTIEKIPACAVEPPRILLGGIGGTKMVKINFKKNKDETSLNSFKDSPCRPARRILIKGEISLAALGILTFLTVVLLQTVSLVNQTKEKFLIEKRASCGKPLCEGTYSGVCEGDCWCSNNIIDPCNNSSVCGQDLPCKCGHIISSERASCSLSSTLCKCAGPARPTSIPTLPTPTPTSKLVLTPTITPYYPMNLTLTPTPQTLFPAIILGRVVDTNSRFSSCADRRFYYGGYCGGSASCQGSPAYVVSWKQKDKERLTNSGECYFGSARYTFEWQGGDGNPKGDNDGEEVMVTLYFNSNLDNRGNKIQFKKWTLDLKTSDGILDQSSHQEGFLNSSSAVQTVKVKVYRKVIDGLEFKWNHLWFYAETPESPTPTPTPTKKITPTLTPKPTPTTTISLQTVNATVTPKPSITPRLVNKCRPCGASAYNTVCTSGFSCHNCDGDNLCLGSSDNCSVCATPGPCHFNISSERCEGSCSNDSSCVSQRSVIPMCHCVKNTPTPINSPTPTLTPTITPTPPRIQPWTFIFFMVGENDLGGYMEQGMSFIVDSGIKTTGYPPKMNIVYLLGTMTNYFKICWRLGEENPTQCEGLNDPASGMGNPDALANLIRYAKEYYPAENYFLEIADHGRATGGIGISYKSGHSLSPADLTIALSAGGANINVLYYHACLMGMLDQAYQIKDYADYWIASENLGWGIYNEFRYLNNAQKELLRPGGRLLPSSLAVSIAESYYNAVSNYTTTISVMDLSKINDVVLKVNSLSTRLKEIPGDCISNNNCVCEARTQTQKFSSLAPWMEITNDDEYLDLYDFSEKVETNCPVARPEAEDVKNAVGNFVIWERHHSGESPNVDNSHGISVFFPLDNRYWDYAVYTNNQLFSYTQVSSWDEFLVKYLGTVPPMQMSTGKFQGIPPMLDPKTGRPFPESKEKLYFDQGKIKVLSSLSPTPKLKKENPILKIGNAPKSVVSLFADAKNAFLNWLKKLLDYLFRFNEGQ